MQIRIIIIYTIMAFFSYGQFPEEIDHIVYGDFNGDKVDDMLVVLPSNQSTGGMKHALIDSYTWHHLDDVVVFPLITLTNPENNNKSYLLAKVHFKSTLSISLMVSDFYDSLTNQEIS